MAKNGERGRKLLDISYLILLACFFFYRVFRNTMFVKTYEIGRFQRLEHLWLYASFALIVLKVLYLRLYSLLELALAVLLCLVCLLAWRESRLYWILMMPLVVVAGKGISFDRILDCFLWIVGGTLLVTYLCTLFALIPNLEYVRLVPTEELPEGAYAISRFAMGTTYPTTFSEFIFFLSAAGLYRRRRCLRFFDPLILLLIAVGLWKVCDARTDVLAVLCLFFISIWLMLRLRLPEKAGKVLNSLSALLIPVMALAASAMTALAVLYSEGSGKMAELDELFHMRLSFGHEGYVKYGITLFGSQVKYKRTGGRVVDQLDVPGYFNLDCSYHLILINFGLILLILLLFLFTLSSYQAWRMKDPALLLILAAVAAECVMENRLIHAQYDVFLLIFFAAHQTAAGACYQIIGRAKEKGSVDQICG